MIVLLEGEVLGLVFKPGFDSFLEVFKVSVVGGVADSQNREDLRKKNNQDGEEEHENLEIGYDGIDHGYDVAEALEDP